MRYLMSFLILLCAESMRGQEHFCAQHKQHSSKQIFGKTATVSQQALMDAYDVVYHHLDVQVERDTTFIAGNVQTLARVTSNQLDTFGFELHRNLSVDSVELSGGQNLTVNRILDYAFVLLPSTLTKNQWIDVKIHYHGTPPKAASAAIGAGFSSKASPSWGNRATWSLSQPYSAYEWWPCKQALQDKIDSLRVSITTSNENKAGSQGLLQQVVNLPNNKVRYEWKSMYPISSYLVSVAVGQYAEYKTYAHLDGDSILIQDYVYSNPLTLQAIQPVLDQTAPMIEAFSAKFGTYPFAAEKYGHSMAPFSGGMEHQTMTTIGVFNFGIVAHELGHQWWGDHVTCATWQDIWLNEGFASYCEYLAYEWLDSVGAKPLMQQVHNRVKAGPTGSIWFTDTTDVGRIFSSRLTYDKGNAFVHILRYEVNNDSLFFAFLKHFQQSFAYRNANTLQFKQSLEQFTGLDFTRVFAQWFYGEGFPVFEVIWKHENDTVYIKTTQTGSAEITPFFYTPVDYRIYYNNTFKQVRVIHDSVTRHYKIPVTGMVGSIQIDPDNWIINDATILQDNTTGLKTKQAATLQLQVFPNPSSGMLEIKSNGRNGMLFLSDIAGRELFHLPLASQLNIEDLEAGTYFLTLKTNEGSTTLKIIKQ
ncbi:MAG: M1 family aminopeptidase [Bacteroidia bacterium]|jgi:aminopeptidase N